MIVSASHRTDIPAFYGEWFRRRLAAGFALSVNPFGGRPYRVGLAPGKADGFVFWTRNAARFGPALADVHARGLPFVVQHTITGYGRALDRFVPAAAPMSRTVHEIAETYGRDAVVWRYDPVVWTDATDPRFHRSNFRRLAETMAEAVNEVVFSFVHPYARTRRNLDAAAKRAGFRWRDPCDGDKRALLSELAVDAVAFGMRPTLCAQPHLLAAPLTPARCVDAPRLNRVAAAMGAPAVTAPEHGNREGCACHRSRDLGAYNTCPHGCVYCYAVNDPRRAAEQARRHDPSGETLVPLPAALHPRGEACEESE